MFVVILGWSQVVLVHGSADAAMEPAFGGIGGAIDGVLDGGFFVFGEFSEDVSYGAAGVGGSDANTQSREFVGAEAVDDVIQAVVSAGRT